MKTVCSPPQPPYLRVQTGSPTRHGEPQHLDATSDPSPISPKRGAPPRRYATSLAWWKPRDMPRPDGWLLAHVPGWNTATVRRFLSMLGEVPVFHFGDLDPNGVRIYRHLREHCPSLRWFVPELWRNHLDHALRREWPDTLSLRGAPQLVRELAAQGLWLEQEPLTFEPGLEEALGLALRGPALGS